MKNRKNLGCRIKGAKERGAWAELYFMALAASQGLRVSSPYGGFASYDVGVEESGPILRVQVKCTMCRHPKGGYSLNIRGPKYRGYPPGTVDFFGLYLIPTDDWYIIPYAVIGNRYATLHFTPGSKREKYARYKEAWHLMLSASKSQSRSHRPIDIRACSSDTDSADLEIIPQTTNSTVSLRKKFHNFFYH